MIAQIKKTVKYYMAIFFYYSGLLASISFVKRIFFNRCNFTGGGGHRVLEENNDEMRAGENAPYFTSNNAGGILGGISNGDPIIVRFAIKPTPSILIERDSVTTKNENTKIITKGRHDPCVGIRAVPVGEAMMALVLADHYLRHRGQTGRDGGVGY